MSYKVAQLSQEEAKKLKDLENNFGSTINKDVILIAYNDEK